MNPSVKRLRPNGFERIDLIIARVLPKLWRRFLESGQYSKQKSLALDRLNKKDQQ